MTTWKVFLHGFIVVLILHSCTSNQTNDLKELTEEQTSEAKSLVQGVFDDVWGGLDSTKISTYHTEDFMILEQGEVWDNDRIRQYIRQALRRKDQALRINKMEYVSVEKYGSAIQLAYYNMADFMQADSLVGQAKWLESALVIETEKGMRIKQMHSTRVPISPE